MIGLMAIHNPQLAVSNPDNTYFNKINRTIRLLLNPAEDELEQHSGVVFQVESIDRVDELDLAFITTKKEYPHWLPLQTGNKINKELMVVGHPNRKFYLPQKARIKHQEKIHSSDYIYFKDNEYFSVTLAAPLSSAEENWSESSA